MRFALVLMIAASAVAAPAFAQPAAPQPQAARQAAAASAAASTPAAGPSEAAAPSHNAEADAALAMSIRMREDAEQRIARIACAAGDKAKCAALESAKAPISAGTPAQ